MVTICNNRSCKNREKPCRAGCIQKGVAEHCSVCENSVCPWGSEHDYVPIPVIHCKKETRYDC